MSRVMHLASIAVLLAGSDASAQGPIRSFLFGRPASNCPGGVCPSPGMASPPAFQPVPAVAPSPMPKDKSCPAGVCATCGCAAGACPAGCPKTGAHPAGGNLYDGSFPVSRMGTGWFGLGVIGPGTGRGLFGRCR